jgi:putative transposase
MQEKLNAADIAAVHASVSNLFNLQRHLYFRTNFKLRRSAALAKWHQIGAA